MATTSSFWMNIVPPILAQLKFSTDGVVLKEQPLQLMCCCLFIMVVFFQRQPGVEKIIKRVLRDNMGRFQRTGTPENPKTNE